MTTSQQDRRVSDDAGVSALDDLRARLAEAMQEPLRCMAEPTPESVAFHDALNDFTTQVARLQSTVRRLQAQRSDEPAK